MNWINIRTEQLRSLAFATANKGAVETWLRVLAYCCEQENGGIIAGAASWSDRQWMITCGVSGDDIANAGQLICVDGESIVVSCYPSDKEKEVKKDRLNGRKGGSYKTQAKTQASRTNGALGGRPRNPSQTQAKTQRKGMEGEWKENGNGMEDGASAHAPESDWIDELASNEAYQHVNIRVEMGKMQAWCKAHRKQPTRRRFLNWINRIEPPLNGQPRLPRLDGDF